MGLGSEGQINLIVISFGFIPLQLFFLIHTSSLKKNLSLNMNTTFSFPWGPCSSCKPNWCHKEPLLLDSQKEPFSFQGRGFNCWLRKKEPPLLKDSRIGFNHSIQKKNKEFPLAGFKPGPPECQAMPIPWPNQSYEKSNYLSLLIRNLIKYKNYRLQAKALTTGREIPGFCNPERRNNPIKNNKKQPPLADANSERIGYSKAKNAQ